jgi:hypothetical protein
MRTLLLIGLLLSLAVAAGLSFVVTAGAGAGLTLERECTPDVLERNVDTLVTCTFTVSNSGAATAPDVRLAFEASSDRIPDRYRFFSYGLDGAQTPVDPGQLTYDVGDIAPGEEKVAEIGVVLRDSQGFGARTVLTAGPGRRRVLEETFRTDVVDPSGHLVYLRFEPQPVATTTVMLAIENAGDADLEDVRIEMSPGPSIDLTGPATWTFDPASGHFVNEPAIAVKPGRMYVSAAFSSPLDCAWAAPTFVVTGSAAGEPVTLALIVDDGIQLDDCDGPRGQGGGGDTGASALPSTGAGRDNDPLPSIGALSAMLVAGAIAAGAGDRLRR